MRAATFKSRCCFSARCAVQRRWHKRSIAKAKKAASCDRKRPLKGRRCGNSKCCRKDGLRNATAGTSSGFGVGVDFKALTIEDTEDTEVKHLALDFGSRVRQYGVVRHVARGHNGVLAAYRTGPAHPSEFGGAAAAWILHPEGCRRNERGTCCAQHGHALRRIAAATPGRV